MTTPDDDLIIAMGLESCWVTEDTAAALIEEGLAERSLFQDPETRAIDDGLTLCDGVTPDMIWEWIRDSDPEASDETDR